jgi:hypothetical protein
MDNNWFQEITNDRSESAITFAKESIKSVKDSITNKYSEKAHFIYELIQNADDVCARSVTFVLKENGLEFSHNGTERFTLSNPNSACEKQDKEKGNLGHINAITSIASSNKVKEVGIGKFGIGFKSVFRYTNTPHIYDEKYQFRIQDYIVPVRLMPGKKPPKNKTIFWFPFDKDDMKPQMAYKEILNKLKHLKETLLFLNHVKNINWESKRDQGEQSIKILTRETYSNIRMDYISSKTKVNKQTNTNLYFKFSKPVPRKKLLFDSVVFLYDKTTRRIVPKKSNAFCFFETKHETLLNFIINAPFELIDNRERLMYSGEKDDWNLSRLKSLAKLAAEAVHLLSTKIDKVKIDYTILDIVPLKTIYYDYDTLPFSMFYDKLLDGFKKNKILNDANGENICLSSAYWTEDTELIKLFTDDLLSKVLRKETSCFVYPEILKEAESDKLKYIREIVDNKVNGKVLIPKISGAITESQSDKWLLKLYKYINKKDLRENTETTPIFINQSGKAKSRVNNNNSVQLFLPEANSNKTSSLHPRFVQNSANENLFKKLGFKLPNLFDDILSKTTPFYRAEKSAGTKKLNADFRRIFECYLNSESTKRSKLIAELKSLKFLKVESKDSIVLKKPEEIHLKTPELVEYFNPALKIDYLDLSYYKSIVSKESEAELMGFFKAIQVNDTPVIIEMKIDMPGKNIAKRRGWVQPKPSPAKRSEQFFFDKEILGAQHILREIEKYKTVGRSAILLNILIKMVKRYGDSIFKQRLQAIHHYTYRKKPKQNPFVSNLVDQLKHKSWLKTHSGEWKKAHELSISELHRLYDIDEKCPDTRSLVEFIGLKGVDLDKVDLKSKLEEDTNLKIVFCTDEEERKAVEDILRKRREEIIEEDFTPTINDDYRTIRSTPFELGAWKSNSISKTNHITKSNNSNKTGITVRRKRSSKYLKQVGDFGERQVQKDLEKEFSSNLHTVINLNDSNSTAVGYDFEVKFKGEVIRYVEVKTTVDNESSKVKLSGAQWEFAKKLCEINEGDKLFVYCVFNAGNDKMSIKHIQNPYDLFVKGKLKAHKVELLISED